MARKSWIVVAFCLGCVTCSFVTRCSPAIGQTVAAVQEVEGGWSIGFSQGLRGTAACASGSCFTKERATKKRPMFGRPTKKRPMFGRRLRGRWFRWKRG